MVISLSFKLLPILLLLSCSALTYNGKPFSWKDDDDPIFRRYTDVEGVDHLWKINMDTLEFPRDNHLLDQNCWYHGGDTFGGESIKLYVDSDGTKHYVIRRVYPHVIEWRDVFAY